MRIELVVALLRGIVIQKERPLSPSATVGCARTKKEFTET
jgi:hypothetical protein